MDEQRGGEYSEASDVWSFGVVIYELIHARPPCADDFTNDECRRLFEESRIAQMIVQHGYAYLTMSPHSPDFFNMLMKWSSFCGFLIYLFSSYPVTSQSVMFCAYRRAGLTLAFAVGEQNDCYRCWKMEAADRPTFEKIKYYLNTSALVPMNFARHS